MRVLAHQRHPGLEALTSDEREPVQKGRGIKYHYDSVSVCTLMAHQFVAVDTIDRGGTSLTAYKIGMNLREAIT